MMIITEYSPINTVKDMPVIEDTKYTLKRFSDEWAIRAIFCKNDMNPWSNYLDNLSTTPRDWE